MLTLKPGDTFAMNQFRVERNDYGNLFIYCFDCPHKGMLLERMVGLKQLNRNTGRYE